MSKTHASPRTKVRGRPPRSLPLFAAIILGVFATLHAVIWWRLVGSVDLPAWGTAGATVALAGLFVSVPAALSARLFGDRVPAGVTGVGYRWLGLSFFWFVLSLLAEPVVRGGAWLAPELPWAGGAAIVVAGLGVGLSVLALAGAGSPAIRRVDIPIRGLAPALDGLRIAQLSDLHVGNTIRRPFVESIVELTNAEGVDLVALTGDFVDGSVRDLALDVAPLAGLRAPHGVFFVTGNHEYFSGGAAWCAEFQRMGFVVLRNETRTIEHDGAKLDIAGIDDPFATEPGHGPDLAAALDGRNRSHPVVLLAHQPVFAEAAAARGVTLMLSGHTHGGQLWPFSLLVRLVQPIVAGLVKVGDSWVYVSRGTGWWGPPMRLAAPNEITILTLRRA